MDFRQQLRENWQTWRPRWIRRCRNSGSPMGLPEGSSADSAPGPRQRLRRHLVERVLREVERRGGSDFNPARGDRVRLRRVLGRALEEAGLTHLGARERSWLEDELVAELCGLGPLDPLLADPSVSDILVNGPDEVWVDRFGRLERTAVRFDDEAHLLRLLGRLAAGHGRHIEEATPYVDVRLPDGSRLHAMIPPLSTGGPAIAIRRMRRVPLQLHQLTASGTMSVETARFLGGAVEAGLNILISGGASTGKTTLMNALSECIPAHERVVTIEETTELRLQHPHVVALETRLPNIEGRGEVTMRTLVRNALRMRADRIIVGEVRGAEVLDMLQSMNLGHNGSLTTVHANSPNDALRRLETLVLMSGFELPARAIRELIGTAFQLVVHMVRTPDGRRRVDAVSDVRLDEDALSTETLVRYEQAADASGGTHLVTGVPPHCLDRIRRVCPAAAALFDGSVDNVTPGVPPVHRPARTEEAAARASSAVESPTQDTAKPGG